MDVAAGEEKPLPRRQSNKRPPPPKENVDAPKTNTAPPPPKSSPSSATLSNAQLTAIKNIAAGKKVSDEELSAISLEIFGVANVEKLSPLDASSLIRTLQSR